MAIKIIISGCCGRMGSRITNLATQDDQIKIVAGLEREGHQAINKDLGEVLGLGGIGSKVIDGLQEVIQQADCIVEFTNPAATVDHAKIAAEHKKAMVIGTTGLNKVQIESVRSASAKISIVMSPNMSVGVNLLFELAAQLATRLGQDYDVEILEAHHRHKKDAPSGTAKKIAQDIAKAWGKDLGDVCIYGRKGMAGERPKGQIAIHAVRAGDIIGDHTVIFGGVGERIELVHKATSRDTFAKGALKAAKFAVGQAPGLYSMQDVLKG